MPYACSVLVLVRERKRERGRGREREGEKERERDWGNERRRRKRKKAEEGGKEAWEACFTCCSTTERDFLRDLLTTSFPLKMRISKADGNSIARVAIATAATANSSSSSK